MPEDELKVYIEKLLKMGYETHLVKENLIKAGHNEKVIEEYLITIIETVHKDLIDYIDSELQKGKTFEDIKNELILKGHPAHKMNHISKYYTLRSNKKNENLLFEDISKKYSKKSLWKIIFITLSILSLIILLSIFAGYLYLGSLQVKDIVLILESTTTASNYSLQDLFNSAMIIMPIICSFIMVVGIIIGVISLALFYIILKYILSIKKNIKEICTIIISYLSTPFLFISISILVNITTLLLLKEISMLNTFLLPLVGFGVYFYNINKSLNQNKSATLTIINIILFISTALIIGFIAFYLPVKAYELIMSTMGFFV